MIRLDKISRRVLLTVAAMPLAAMATQILLHPASAQAKVSKAVAKYQDKPKGAQRCEICINFQPPNQCQFVEDDISPKGWCTLFAARENAQ